MRRKIIRQGSKEHGTYTITLPVKWVKQYGIKGGDEIEVEERGSTVVVQSLNALIVPKEVTIDGREFTLTQIRRHLSEAYRSGAQSITLLYKDKVMPQHRISKRVLASTDIVAAVTDEMIGMEIEHKTAEKIVIRQFGEAIEEEFETALRKIFSKMHEQIDLALEALTTMNHEQLFGLWAFDRGINRYVNFCLRVLNKKGHPDPKKLTNYYAALVQLEFLGDIIYMIGIDAAHFKMKKVDSSINEYLRVLQKAIDAYTNYFYACNEHKVVEIIDYRQKLHDFENNNSKFKKLDVFNSRLLMRIHLSFDLLTNLTDQAISIGPCPE